MGWCCKIAAGGGLEVELDQVGFSTTDGFPQVGGKWNRNGRYGRNEILPHPQPLSDGRGVTRHAPMPKTSIRCFLTGAIISE
jgi:hypothetical protein